MPARAKMMLAMALAASGVATDARADSAVGTNFALGSELNPSGQFLGSSTGRLSNFYEQSRSPTGLLYPRPPLLPELVQSSSSPNWWSSAWAEVGVIGTTGKTGVAAFREYGDLSAGPLISNAGFLAENHETAYYVSANVGNVARDDQYYQLNVGKYGLFNTTLSFSSIPHVFSTNSKVLWNGAGTGQLTLPAGLTPGTSTAAQVQAAFTATAPTEVKLTREKAGFALSYMPSEEYEFFLNVGNEWRNGDRGFGATFGMPAQAGVTELLEPIKYRTLDVNGGVRFKGEELQANITYVGSFFHNDIDSLVWENPGLSLLAANIARPPRGRMALTPSNDYNTIKGDVAWTISPKTRFAASAAYATMRQDEALIPPTINTAVIPVTIPSVPPVASTINLNNWNTVGALSRSSADAEIDTYNLFAQFEYNPMSELRLDLEMRGRGEDNKTDYLSLNPLTGQYGYIALDGGLAQNNPNRSGIYMPTVAGSRQQIRNVPYAHDYYEVAGKAAYQLANRDRLQLALTHKENSYDSREIAKSQDERVSTQFSSRTHEWGTIRLTYEYAHLKGDDYIPYPYAPYESSSLPGYLPAFPTGDAPFTLNEIRKFDVADRTENVIKGQTNILLSEKVDFQLSGEQKIDRYGAAYGLRKANTYNINGGLNFQLSLNTSFNFFYTFQSRDRDTANIRSGTVIASAAAGSSSYPLANGWKVATSDRSHVFGVGAHHKIDNVTLDVNYTKIHSNAGYGYTYASPAAFAAQLNTTQAGSAFSPTKFEDQVLETNVLWNYTEKLGVRFYYRFENESVDDFHYTGLTNVILSNIYLGAIPQNYAAHVFGIFFQYSY
jgi:hypothetical protein